MRAIIAAAVAVLCSTQTARGDAQADPKLVARAIERAGKIGGGGLAEGSAPDFVDRLCEDIALGADGEFLAKSFDLAIIPPSPGDPLRNLAEHLDSVLVQFRAAAGRGDATYLGWLVDPRVTVTDGATWVRLDVVYKNGIGEPGHSETRVALTGAAPHWRILDVVADGMSLREDLADLPGIARDDALAAIRDALATGRFADALEEAQRAVALFPEDGAARSHLATALYYAYQFEAAGTEADRAIKLDPRQVQVHALRARLHLTRGDDRAARAAALQAAELGDLEGARLVEQLDIVAAARERLLGRRPALAEGSAPAFVDDHLSMLVAGSRAVTLATVLDPEVWTGPGLSPEIVARVVDDELASLRRGPTRLLGWYVSPNARTVDGQVSVSIEMPVATEVTQPLRDRIAASLGGAAVALEDVPAGIRDRLAAMSPTQWGMTLDGLVGRQIRAVSRVEIVMNGAPGGWRVVDVVHDGVSFRGEVPDRAAALAKAPHHRPSSVSAWVGALIATSFAIVVLAVVFRRRRRRG